MTLRIDWLPVSRLEELQAFVDEHWRRGHVLARDAELLRWQHRRRADPETLAVLLAEEDGRIAAMLGWIEFDACVGMPGLHSVRPPGSVCLLRLSHARRGVTGTPQPPSRPSHADGVWRWPR